MPDPRLPLVSWSLTTRQGSFEDPKGKEGLSGITNAMIRRGSGDMTYAQLAQDLESRAITIEISDGGDYTRLSGSCTTPQLEHAMLRTRQLLDQPTFPESEFAKLKDQVQAELELSQENPTAVATEDLNSRRLYGDTPNGPAFHAGQRGVDHTGRRGEAGAMAATSPSIGAFSSSAAM